MIELKFVLPSQTIKLPLGEARLLYDQLQKIMNQGVDEEPVKKEIKGDITFYLDDVNGK